jgi:DNA recombination protein RmuC
VSRKLQAAAISHNEAMKKLSSGQGNALSRAQKLKSLGVASKKTLPAVLIEGESHTIPDDDAEAELQITDENSSPPNG